MYKVVFFGSSHYCHPTLDALYNDSNYELVAIVSQPDKPVGRKHILTPTAVSLWAQEHDIPLLTPTTWKNESQNESVQKLHELKPDAAILAVYGKIVPQYLIDLFPHGIINLHPSLLPKYRGPAPANFVILNGDKNSGITIMLLTKEMDAGPILAVEEFEVSPSETPDSYYTKSFQIGTNLLLNILPTYLEGLLKPHEQDHTKATYTKLLTRDDGRIDWDHPAEQIERQIRAMTPWPGTWTIVNEIPDGKITNFHPKNRDNRRVKIIQAEILNDMLKIKKIQFEGEKIEDIE